MHFKVLHVMPELVLKLQRSYLVIPLPDQLLDLLAVLLHRRLLYHWLRLESRHWRLLHSDHAIGIIIARSNLAVAVEKKVSK